MIHNLTAAIILAASGLWAQTAANLEGTVLNSISRSGVAGVAVELKEGNGPEPSYRATTDSTGKFRLRDLAPGEYAISFEKEGFVASEINGHRTIEVPASGGPLILTAELLPLGTVGGRVVDDQRQPIGGIAVEILRLYGRGEQRSGNTDAAGRFQFAGLKPGTYFIRANLNRRDLGSKLQLQKVAPSPPSDGTVVVRAPVYLPGVQKSEMAMPIVIRDGENLAGYEIRVATTSFYRISGTVFDDSGKPVQKARVKLKSADSSYYFGLFGPEAEVLSGYDGSFEFAHIGQGEWRLIAEAAADRTEAMGILKLTVRNLDLENVQVVMHPSFALGVFFEWRQSQRERPEKAPQLMLMPLDASSGLERYSDGADVERQQIRHLYQGRYRITAPARAGFYLDSVMLGDEGVAGREIEIQAASPPIRLIYKSDGGRVHGIVEKCAGASIVLLPQDTELFDQAAISRCDDNGKFEIRDLRPGSYYAIALQYLDWDALREPIFLQSLIPYSVIVKVNRNETAWAELRVAQLH